MTRTFLLYADGYSKEMDINSASPDSVEPLPFHGMTTYPYGPGEHYPHREAVGKYNTRVVSRAILRRRSAIGDPTSPSIENTQVVRIAAIRHESR